MTQSNDEHPTNEENEIIYLPELLVRNIDKIVKNLKMHRNREEFIATAIEKFIADALKEKIENVSYSRL